MIFTSFVNLVLTVRVTKKSVVLVKLTQTVLIMKGCQFKAYFKTYCVHLYKT